MLRKSEALALVAAGKTLVGNERSEYPGETVEYLPRVDEANGHPDFYAWRVTGRSDHDRLNVNSLNVRDERGV